MIFENLLQHADELIRYMEDENYSQSYVLLLKTEINWLKKNGYSVSSYEEACQFRQSQTESPEMQRRYRLEYGILKRFDLDGIFPDYRMKEPLIKRGSYHQLNPIFREVVDTYHTTELKRGLKPQTIKGNMSAVSCYLLSMQNKGCCNLSDINEKATLAFFTDDSGNVALSNGYRKQISLVFKADLGKFNEDAKRILAYLPKTRPHRKNIQYLQPEEVERLHESLFPDAASTLTLRNRAIGVLLFFTALRACDIAALTLEEIDWENDEIRLVQDKTDVPLILPMSAMVGNALYDYIVSERPDSNEKHVFLSKNRPYDPISPSAIFSIASKLYDAASIRMEPGERRSSHLFRYNAATTLISKGVPRPVVSAILGHEDPASLDYYTFADIPHLRECALSIAKFPVKKGVFDL